MSSEEWRVLPLSNRDSGLPKLLFKLITNSAGFELSVTDLLHYWKASGDRASITKEAARSRSSIDPSEDAGQLGILLSKLKDGLSGENGARCRVGLETQNKSYSDHLESFTLFSYTPLPVPLQPLLWKFHLLRQGQMLLTHKLLLPALAVELRYETQIEDLKNRIQEKDHVITRLMDKIEQSSMDLSLVFPGYSTGRKSLTAQQAWKVVPGISRFNNISWQKDFRRDELTTTRSLAEAFRRPASDDILFEIPRDLFHGSEEWKPFSKPGNYKEDWVSDLKYEPMFSDEDVGNGQKGQTTRTNITKNSTGKGQPLEPVAAESASISEHNQAGDLSKNATSHWTAIQSLRNSNQQDDSTSSDDSPPLAVKADRSNVGRLARHRHRKPSASKKLAPNKSASTTSSSSDFDLPELLKKAKHSPHPGSTGATRRASPIIGTRQSRSPTATSSTPATPSRKLGALGGKRDRSIQPDSSSPAGPQTGRQPALSTSTPTTPSRKLGVISGRHLPQSPHKEDSKHKPDTRKTRNAGSSSPDLGHDDNDHDHSEGLDATKSLSASSSSSPSPSPSATAASHSAITTSKKRKNKNHHHDNDDDPTMEVSEQPDKEEATTTMTVEETADRKREELKRTLEAGGGKKKKRKF